MLEQSPIVDQKVDALAKVIVESKLFSECESEIDIDVYGILGLIVDTKYVLFSDRIKFHRPWCSTKISPYLI